MTRAKPIKVGLSKAARLTGRGVVLRKYWSKQRFHNECLDPTQSGIKWTSYLNTLGRIALRGHSTHSKDSLKQNLFIKEWHGSSLSFGASSLLPWQDNAVGSSFLLGSQVTKLLTWYDPFRLLEKIPSVYYSPKDAESLGGIESK